MRHGHLPEREIMTGIGPVAVRRPPRARPRGADDCERIRFSPAILPPYARRSKSMEMLIPILYLKGISTGDFEEALSPCSARTLAGLSASTIGAAQGGLLDDHGLWGERDLSGEALPLLLGRRHSFAGPLEGRCAQCILVIIGATPEGKKELVGLTTAQRARI